MESFEMHGSSPKEWFIFQRDHHEGPFSKKDILFFLKDQKLERSSTVWKEGQPDWMTLDEVDEFQPYIDDEFLSSLEVLKAKRRGPKISSVEFDYKVDPNLQPTLEVEALIQKRQSPAPPPLPEHLRDQDTTIKNLNLPPTPEFCPPAIPHLDNEIKKLTRDKIDEEIERLQNLKFEKVEKNPFFTKRLLVACLAVVMLTLSAYGVMAYQYQQWRPRPLGMAFENYQALKKVANMPLKEGIKVAFTLSNKGGKIWMASNFPRDLLVSMKLTSVTGKVLSKENIVVQSRSVFKDRLARFRKFNMLKGSALSSGKYIAEIETLRPVNGPIWEKWVFGEYKTLTIREEIYLGSVSEEEYKRKLAVFNQHLKADKRLKFQDISQKISTLKSLLNQIDYLYFHTLMNITRGSQVSQFEAMYHGKVGALLQKITFDNDKIYTSLAAKNHALAKQYKKLINLGKDTGILVATMVESTTKQGRLTKVVKNRLQQRFKRRINTLKDKMDDQLKAVEKLKIKSIL